jgi:ribosomal protein S11
MILSVLWRATTLPTGPKGQKRPADVIGNAVHVMRIATGEIEDDTPVDDGSPRQRPIRVPHTSLGPIPRPAAR